MNTHASMPVCAVRVASVLLIVSGSACALVRPDPAGPSTAERALSHADSLRIQVLHPGVRYLYAWDRAGPWGIHVLEVRKRCAPEWQARKSGPPIGDRATTSALAFDALAAVNADFFALPQGVPVGTHVSANEVVIGPADRPLAVGFTQNRAWIDATRLEGRILGRRLNAPIVQVNRARPAAGAAAVRLFTHWYGASAPADSLVTSVRVRHLQPGLGVVELVDSMGNAIWLDTTHVVIHLPRNTPVRLADTIRWSVAVRGLSVHRTAQEALGGFPWLLRAGQDVLSQQSGVSADFGNRRHPRSAIGFAGDETTLLVVVDGRQLPYSDGMTLRELADLMHRMGADDALNFDGGGSSTLTASGRILNRPSDSAGERPVGNALALVRCR